MARDNCGLAFDCADFAIYQLIQFAHHYSLPIHLEGHATGGPRVYDNDAMEYETWQELAEAVGSKEYQSYGASEFHSNSTIFLSPAKKPNDLQIGDLVMWRYPKTRTRNHHVFHVQIVLTIWNGNYEGIQGTTGGNVYSKLYDIDDTFGWGNGGIDMVIRSWNFDYFDKFVFYNSMEERVPLPPNLGPKFKV